MGYILIEAQGDVSSGKLMLGMFQFPGMGKRFGADIPVAGYCMDIDAIGYMNMLKD